MSVIQVKGLRKTYRDGFFFGRRIEALRGADLDVRPGEIFGLLGPNGAGKTTMIKILLGIVRKSQGEATLLGQPAGNRRARQKVGYLPEGHRLPRHLTGNTALEYYGGLSGLSPGEVRRRAPPLLNRVELTRWGKTSVRKYSKGMLQRLGLAQAMLHDPDVLILDEPTDGVDPVGRKAIREILHEWKAKGKTIFLNSHLLQEIELVCDRVAILAKGRVLKIGDVQEITREVGAELANQVQLNMLGDASKIRAALEGFRVIDPEVEGQRCTVTVLLEKGQPDLDRCIDVLRATGISIHSVSPRTMTLEEAFMKLVKDSEQAVP
jgi:ABC-2 type transport system ATP-binding protein